MILTRDGIYNQQKDLHIGGLGTRSNVNTLISAEAFMDDAGSLLEKLREAATQADEFVRARPWQAIGVAALLSFAAGLLLARRF